jgi:hypothetical protein
MCILTRRRLLSQRERERVLYKSLKLKIVIKVNKVKAWISNVSPVDVMLILCQFLLFVRTYVFFFVLFSFVFFATETLPPLSSLPYPWLNSQSRM